MPICAQGLLIVHDQGLLLVGLKELSNVWGFGHKEDTWKHLIHCSVS